LHAKVAGHALNVLRGNI